MEFQYKKAMEKNDLSISDLPEDAQTGIAEINKVLAAIKMRSGKGKGVSAAMEKKLRAMDKWVYYEILDYLHDTDKNDDDIPFDAEDVLENDKNGKKDDDGAKEDGDQNDISKSDPIGLKIEAELEQLYASGKTSYSIEELTETAPDTYNVLFDSYEEGEENGVVTSRFSLIEGQDKKFTLKQN